MNIILQKERVDSFIDRTKSPRFYDRQYINSLNSAITQTFKDRSENEKKPESYQFESNEQVMRELYSLIVGPVNIAPVGDTVPYPADYRFLGQLTTTVDGQTTYARPITSKQRGAMLKDPFRKPKPSKTYYEELATAFLVFHNGTSFTNASFTYLKYPATVSLGQESDKIFGGGNVIPFTQYIVYDDCVYNGTSYAAGAVFTSGATTPLTSGTVIPTSVIVDCDMPDNIQDEICKIAADLMMLSVEEYNKSQLLDQRANEA